MNFEILEHLNQHTDDNKICIIDFIGTELLISNINSILTDIGFVR